MRWYDLPPLRGYLNVEELHVASLVAFFSSLAAGLVALAIASLADAPRPFDVAVHFGFVGYLVGALAARLVLLPRGTAPLIPRPPPPPPPPSASESTIDYRKLALADALEQPERRARLGA